MLNLSIIIVSWNVKNLLERCLKSIIQRKGNLKIEVIVVDNNSTDDTREMIKEKFLNNQQIKFHLIANEKNYGFATANNQGILSSQGQHILLLNPDTEVLEGCLENAISFIENQPRAGVVGCRHLNPDWTLQHSVRRFPKLWPIFLILTKIAKIFRNLKSVDYYLAKDFNYKITQQVDQVAGSFFLIRKELIDDIGLFDEKFYIWFEEVDFCKRATNSGWEVWYFKDAEIMHYGGRSFNQQVVWRKQLIFLKSAIYYFQKHGFR